MATGWDGVAGFLVGGEHIACACKLGQIAQRCECLHASQVLQ